MARRIDDAREDIKLLLFGVLLSAFFLATNSPEFRVQKLVILTRSTTLARAIAPLSPSGISIFFYPYFAERKLILQSDPSMQEVKFRVATLFPLTLSVQPIPRVPVVFLHCRGKKLALDRQGIIFPDPEYSTGIREGELQAHVALLPGKLLPSPYRERLPTLLAALDTFAAVQFPRFAFSDKGECFLYTSDGICVRIGSLQELWKKLTILPPILQIVQTRKIAVAYIDLRDVNAPYIKTIGVGDSPHRDSPQRIIGVGNSPQRMKGAPR